MKSLPRNSLSAQLYSFLKTDKGWSHKGRLTADMVWRHPSGAHYGARYLPETVGRTLRSLEEVGLIAVKKDGISTIYKALVTPYKEKYIPYSQRPNHLKHILFKP